MEPQSTIAQHRVGTLLGGKYELLRLVGAGGMGAVYESRNAWTGRRVAIKVLHPEFARKQEVLARFFREAQAATRIAHPNIVEVFDLGQDPADGAFYIVQEFLDGRDLRAVMDEAGAMSPRRAVEIIGPVMAALAAAHAHGVVHRDIKPENIFVSLGPDGSVTPKLIDFGVSKMVDHAPDLLSRTMPGTTLGTPYYMSPEQCRGDALLDGRSDVWGVGAVLYEMLSGELAFDAPNYNSLIVKIVTSAPEPLVERAPGVPASLAALVHRALTAKLDARLPSMEAFLDALQRCPLDAPPPSRSPSPRAPSSRVSRPLAVGFGVACALLLGLASRGSAVHSAPAPVARPAVAPVARIAPAVVEVVEVPVVAARPRAIARPRSVAAPRTPPRSVVVATVPPALATRSANGALILPP
jgi:serine/threonine-protein kinase